MILNRSLCMDIGIRPSHRSIISSEPHPVHRAFFETGNVAGEQCETTVDKERNRMLGVKLQAHVQHVPHYCWHSHFATGEAAESSAANREASTQECLCASYVVMREGHG